MYLEADVDNCNYLSFNLAEAATTAAQVIINKGITTLATRTWDMTVEKSVIYHTIFDFLLTRSEVFSKFQIYKLT